MRMMFFFFFFFDARKHGVFFSSPQFERCVCKCLLKLIRVRFQPLRGATHELPRQWKLYRQELVELIEKYDLDGVRLHSRWKPVKDGWMLFCRRGEGVGGKIRWQMLRMPSFFLLK